MSDSVQFCPGEAKDPAQPGPSREEETPTGHPQFAQALKFDGGLKSAGSKAAVGGFGRATVRMKLYSTKGRSQSLLEVKKRCMIISRFSNSSSRTSNSNCLPGLASFAC